MKAPLVSLVLLAALSASSATDDVLTRFLLPESLATKTGARCLDGSVAGGYVAAGDPHKFVIFLQGGGLW